MDALVRKLQQAERQPGYILGPATVVSSSQKPSQEQRGPLQHSVTAAVHTVQSWSRAAAAVATLATGEEVQLSEVADGGNAAQVLCYSSCPTAVDEPLSPYIPPSRGWCTTALPSH